MGQKAERAERARKQMVRAVINLGLAGEKPSSISKLTGITTRSASSILYRARKEGIPVPKFPAGQPKGDDDEGPRVYIRRRVAMLVATDAKRRGMTPRQLVERLIETIAKDGMVAAVLDD